MDADLSIILDGLQLHRSMDVKDIIENMIDSVGLVRVAAIPFIKNNCQQLIVSAIKRLIMDPYFNRLPQMLPLLLCLKNCAFILQHPDYRELGLVVEANKLSLLRDQVTQLAAIFNSKIDTANKSYERFRMQFMYKPPILIGYSSKSWSKQFTYENQSVFAFDVELSPLLEYLSSSIQISDHGNKPVSKEGLPSSEIILIGEESFLNLALSFCKENSRKTFLPIAINNDFKCSSRRDSRHSQLIPAKISGIMLAYLINAIPLNNRSSCISSVVFILGSNLHKSIRNIDFQSVNNEEMKSIIIEIIYTISLACSIYFNLFQDTKSDDKNERGAAEQKSEINTKINIDNSALDDCHELLSWSLSLIFSNKNISKYYLDSTINSIDVKEPLNQETIQCHTSSFSMNTGSPEKGENYSSQSIFQYAVFLFLFQPGLKGQNRRKKFLFLCEKSLNYLNLNMKNNFDNKKINRNNENTLHLLNSTEAFHEVVCSVLYPICSRHRNAIKFLSESYPNPKLFFSLYCLQCCFILSICSAVEHRLDECNDDDNRVPTNNINNVPRNNINHVPRNNIDHVPRNNIDNIPRNNGDNYDDDGFDNGSLGHLSSSCDNDSDDDDSNNNNDDDNNNDDKNNKNGNGNNDNNGKNNHTSSNDNNNNDNNNGNNNADHDYNNNNNNNNSIDVENTNNCNNRKNKDRVTITVSTTKYSSLKNKMKNSAILRINRNEVFSIISMSALRMIPADRELFCRILCDSFSCAIEIEIKKERKIIDVEKRKKKKKKDNNILNKNIQSLLCKEHSLKESYCQEYNQRSNIIESIMILLFDVAEEIKISLSMILSASIKSKNYHPLKGNSPQSPGVSKNLKSTTSENAAYCKILEMSSELGSGFLPSAIVLLGLGDGNRSQEVFL